MTVYNSTIHSCLLKIAYRNQYDVLSNVIVREIFQKLIIAQEFFVMVEKENVIVRVRAGKNGKEDGKTTDKTNFNFTINAHTRPQIDEMTEISIGVDFKNGFSKNDYSSFNFSLYEAIRHEIERAHQFNIGKYPDESYKEKQDNMFINFTTDANGLSKHIQSVSDYISSNEEIESYARSIMYVAKKQKKHQKKLLFKYLTERFLITDLMLQK